MERYVIPGTKDWTVIVKGPVEAAQLALGLAGIHRPYRNLWVNGYGAIHATVAADRDQLEAWFRRSHERLADGSPQPGALCFYFRR